jgi:hypothetical protein
VTLDISTLEFLRELREICILENLLTEAREIDLIIRETVELIIG